MALFQLPQPLKTTFFEYPLNSGHFYAFWASFVIYVLPLTSFTPKNDHLIPQWPEHAPEARVDALRSHLNKAAINLLHYLQEAFPHKHNEPGLEEDSSIHQFLMAKAYQPYTKMDSMAERKKWLENKMAYLATRGLVERVYDRKKRNYWYSWSLMT